MSKIRQNVNQKEMFHRTWEKLTRNINKIVRMSEANRRILAGLTTLLIKKGMVSSEEINALETEVLEAMKKNEMQGGR